MWIGSPASTTPGFDLLWVILYIGPDVMLPLTSALAAIAGVLLMFWQRVVGLLRSARDLLVQRQKTPRA
jgi:hypothetical protein